MKNNIIEELDFLSECIKEVGMLIVEEKPLTEKRKEDLQMALLSYSCILKETSNQIKFELEESNNGKNL